MRLGRAADNDLELDDLRVSRHHAEVRQQADGTRLVVDLGSQNGTFVNGRRVHEQRLTPGDFLGIGGQTIHYINDELRISTVRHTAWFGAVDLVVSASGHRILDEVGFALEPSSMLAIVGPSGSGKSTLLNALTGFRPADSGSVVFDGRDFYASYDDMRSRMGLVPQADIIHTELTVRQALSYSAELRFAPDVTAETRRARIEEVMAELHLSGRADVRIDLLSGGQRKRVSVAGELLTRPSLLFLDEPTSGLDPGNEADLMDLLRDLARAGRTVVVVTHSVQSLDLCDRLVVLAPGGRLAFYGVPADALTYFGDGDVPTTYPEIFRRLEERTDVDWKARFRSAPAFERLVQTPLGSPDLEALPPRPDIDPPPPPTPTAHQLSVLVRRYLQVIRADRGLVIGLALQAPIFGILFALMFHFNTLLTSQALNASVLIWLVIVGATWLGMSNAIREIVKELPIFRRERAIGLSTGAYVMSKVIVLGTITAIQAAVLVPIAMWFQEFPPREAEMPLAALGLAPAGSTTFAAGGSVLPSQVGELVVVCIAVGIASMAIALCLSALAGGMDRAATLLPVILVAQVIVSAPLFNAPNVVLSAVGLVTGAQWGMAAAASTVSLEDVRRPYLVIDTLTKLPKDEQQAAIDRALKDRVPIDVTSRERATWRHTASAWITDMGALAGLTIFGLAGAWLALRRADPDLMEGRHPGRWRRRWLRRPR